MDPFALIFLLFFFFMGAVLVLEMILSASWNYFYFSFGIPVYKKTFSFPQEKPNLDLEKLTDRFKGSVTTPLEFKRVSATDVAFREAPFRMGFFLSYTPVMTGIITTSLYAKTISVCGHLKYFNIFFLLFWYAIVVFMIFHMEDKLTGYLLAGLFSIAPPLILGSIYTIQKSKYDEITKIMKAQNS